MSRLRHPPTVLIWLGTTIVGSALIWWGLTFGPTASNDYLSIGEVGRCLVAESSLCRLATALCVARHDALVAAYFQPVHWIGAVVACSGLWQASSPKSADDGAAMSRRGR